MSVLQIIDIHLTYVHNNILHSLSFVNDPDKEKHATNIERNVTQNSRVPNSRIIPDTRTRPDTCDFVQCI